MDEQTKKDIRDFKFLLKLMMALQEREQNGSTINSNAMDNDSTNLHRVCNPVLCISDRKDLSKDEENT